MKIVILGGTGLIGSALQKSFSKIHQVEVFNRTVFKSAEYLSSIIDGSDFVIQLAGSTISKRWSQKIIAEMWQSRVNTNQMLSDAIKLITKTPRVICSSGISFYAESDCNDPKTEDDIQGEGYLTDLNIAVESAAKSILDDVTILRFGVVLSRKGGALAKLYWPYYFGVGGPIMSGNQCFSWIHIDDLVKAFHFLINDPQSKGIYNITSPEPVPQKVFGRALAKSLKRPFFIPVWEWQLKILLGKGSQVLTLSASVIPMRLIQAGFVFDYPDIDTAMRDLIG
ncbi:TIGR01777 family oxidoreductase [Candidatus Pseudothioglobus singularis]|nr:TIGR01777 family oxidoreductase [Candidatus Pseudothioglobus singularis]